MTLWLGVGLATERSWVRFPARHRCVITLAKLFTPMCLCHQCNLVFGTGIIDRKVMVGYGRSVAKNSLPAQHHGNGDEHCPQLSQRATSKMQMCESSKWQSADAEVDKNPHFTNAHVVCRIRTSTCFFSIIC